MKEIPTTTQRGLSARVSSIRAIKADDRHSMAEYHGGNNVNYNGPLEGGNNLGNNTSNKTEDPWNFDDMKTVKTSPFRNKTS